LLSNPKIPRIKSHHHLSPCLSVFTGLSLWNVLVAFSKSLPQ